ncbi:MAG: Ig-like domain-containing protein [Candidatus Azobacteroides sp.]|nr:Ig-like domain-containing protein [Candidatus Azobacteroides sp.]
MKIIKEIKRRRGRIVSGFSALLVILYFSFFPFLFPSCASIGNPTGGAFDTIPPTFIRSKPAPNSIRFSGNKMELLFDEYINIEKPSEKVIITPPQNKMPIIRSLGKKVLIELKDSLISNTTYTFDFTNGIVDNNEKNAIEGFTYAFSTGDVVDSLVVSGLLLNAENLEPMPNIMVGLHSDLADSAFTTLPFLRTSMTNDRGQFWIRNIAPGTYRLYALNDLNRNYKFDQVKEDIAFYDSPITPDFIPAIRMDTIRIDSLTIDTIKEIQYNRFIPDDIILYLFKETADNTQYLSKFERPTDRQLIFRFNSTQGLPPKIYLLEEDFPNENLTDLFIPEYSDDKKNITYWITDSLIYKQDTIRVEANYLMSDSLNNLIPVTDTLRFVWRNREAAKKNTKKGKNSEEKINFLKIDCSAKNIMDVFDTLKITFSEPVIDFDFDKIKIQQKVDTLWEERKFPIVGDTLNPRVFYVEHTWPYEQEYRITIDSAAIYSIYGNWNDSVGTQFKFYSEKDYGNLYVKIIGGEGPGFGELLDNSERVICKSVLTDEELAFEDLKPGNYFLRYTEDINGNGKWDTGNYAEKQQPEKVYYFQSALTISKYGSHEQDWDIKQIPIEKQKPLDITKNKPVVKQPKRTEQKNQNRQQNTGRSNSMRGQSIPGLGNRIPGI